ncbi:MAG: hypothetical protein QXL52_05885 [Nitrososphaerales archaeon]
MSIININVWKEFLNEAKKAISSITEVFNDMSALVEVVIHEILMEN